MLPFQSLSSMFGVPKSSAAVEPATLEPTEVVVSADQTIATVAESRSSWFDCVAGVGSAATGSVRDGLATAMIVAIRQIAHERDRSAVVDWLAESRKIIGEAPTSQAAAAGLYQHMDAAGAAQLAVRTLGTTFTNFQNSKMPLALKIALPVTALGACVVGAKGAGVVALGTGVGLPVVALLFLGTAGLSTVIEAFVRDPALRDPLTKLVVTMAEFDRSRRAKKELLAAMREQATVPRRAPVADDLDSSLFAMDPFDFERHVMSFFEPWGHATGCTPQSNDFGVDGYVFHPDGVIVVQCKRYALDNPVGRPQVQQFKGVIEEQQAFRGFIVTTGRFTDEARESAGKSSRVVLIDGPQLAEWHREGRALPQL